MYTQVIGKLRLALSPFEPQWANVALYPTARGLATPAVPYGLRTFDAEFDFVDHQLVLRNNAGGLERLALHSQAVAEFYTDVTAALTRLGVDVTISTLPSEVPDPIRFPEDEVHRAYDAPSVERFWRILSNVAVVMNRHHARFWGKTSAVHFFWGSFDLALTRYSGRRVEPPAGSGTIYRLGGDAELVCAGSGPAIRASRRPRCSPTPTPSPTGSSASGSRRTRRTGATRWASSCAVRGDPDRRRSRGRDHAVPREHLPGRRRAARLERRPHAAGDRPGRTQVVAI